MSGRWEPMPEQLVHERYARLLSRAMLLCGTRHDAEDLVQDALVAAFGGRARFASLNEAEQYVRRAIASRYVDRGRSRTRERDAHLRLAGHAQPVVEIELPGIERDVVLALAELPPRERTCVVLRHVEDLSVREVAETLSLSEGAVKRYTADGVARLNAVLGTTSQDTGVETVPVEQKEVRRGA